MPSIKQMHNILDEIKNRARDVGYQPSIDMDYASKGRIHLRHRNPSFSMTIRVVNNDEKIRAVLLDGSPEDVDHDLDVHGQATRIGHVEIPKAYGGMDATRTAYAILGLASEFTQ